MRRTENQIDAIRQRANQLAGVRTQACVFGFRLDGTAKGCDLDLLLELQELVENPAMLATNMPEKVSRRMTIYHNETETISN
jgi:hypothetical protein